ncbi:hypothetical protein CCMSSC00406_0009465 [Pleurotus cornucopiae]|uniref:Uncharacterized protein n=1 Tax=Pleurotus cornucopiae TaxID=5321 RepID=A0ACB7J1K3_PLECO|nr:hypothetical protein CCMSSC00406_0009465 [Pleurotus cornucopiae]
MDVNNRLLFYASLAVSIPLLVWNSTKSNRKTPLPPGPPADPLIGHLLRFPSENAELAFHEWSKQYGKLLSCDVIHLCVLGRSIIVLDSHQAAMDLLEKRSALYSDRPRFIVFDLMGWDPDVVFMPYGQRFRKHRKLFHTYFMQKSCLQFQPVQLHNAHLLVHGLMKNEGNHDQLLARFTTAIAIRIAYGHQIISDDDEYIDILDKMGTAVRAGGLTGGNTYRCVPYLGMSLDPNIYANPSVFNPTRFLPKLAGGNGEPPFDAAFGYGRRICPGRHLASASLWIAIATIFSIPHISKARDEKGMEITPPVEFESGISSQPKPFPCSIVARSNTAARIIAEAIENSV